MYTHAYPRQYAIVAPGGTRYHAYRMTFCRNDALDEFYGVQGSQMLSIAASLTRYNG